MPMHSAYQNPSPQTLRQLAFDQSIHWTSLNAEIWRALDNTLWAVPGTQLGLRTSK